MGQFLTLKNINGGVVFPVVWTVPFCSAQNCRQDSHCSLANSGSIVLLRRTSLLLVEQAEDPVGSYNELKSETKSRQFAVHGVPLGPSYPEY